MNKMEDTFHEEFWYVEWLDHASFKEAGWRTYDDIEELLTPVKVCSVGWKTVDSDSYIVLCPHNSFDEGNGQGSLCILKTDIMYECSVPFSYVKAKEKE